MKLLWSIERLGLKEKSFSMRAFNVTEEVTFVYHKILWGNFLSISLTRYKFSGSFLIPLLLPTHNYTWTHVHTHTLTNKHTPTCTPTHSQASAHSPTRMNKQVITNGQVHIDRIASAAFKLHKLSSNWSPEDQETKIVFFGDGLAKDSCRLICSTRKPLLLAFASNVLFLILSHSMFPFSFLSFSLSFSFLTNSFTLHAILCQPMSFFLFCSHSLLLSFSSAFLSLFSLSVTLNFLSFSFSVSLSISFFLSSCFALFLLFIEAQFSLSFILNVLSFSFSVSLSFLTLFLFLFHKLFLYPPLSFALFTFFSLSVTLNVLSHSMGPFSFLHLSNVFPFSLFWTLLLFLSSSFFLRLIP